MSEKPKEPAKTQIVSCPRCQKSTRFDASNEFRPFCCKACSDRDIIAWANEDYVVAGRPADPEEIAGELTKKNDSD